MSNAEFGWKVLQVFGYVVALFFVSCGVFTLMDIRDALRAMAEAV